MSAVMVTQLRPKLSGQDLRAIYGLQKRGELILRDGYFVNALGYGGVEEARMQRLARLGYARIDRVGETTFAVFVKGLEPKTVQSFQKGEMR